MAGQVRLGLMWLNILRRQGNLSSPMVTWKNRFMIIFTEKKILQQTWPCGSIGEIRFWAAYPQMHVIPYLLENSLSQKVMETFPSHH